MAQDSQEEPKAGNQARLAIRLDRGAFLRRQCHRCEGIFSVLAPEFAIPPYAKDVLTIPPSKPGRCPYCGAGATQWQTEAQKDGSSFVAKREVSPNEQASAKLTMNEDSTRPAGQALPTGDDYIVEEPVFSGERMWPPCHPAVPLLVDVSRVDSVRCFVCGRAYETQRILIPVEESQRLLTLEADGANAALAAHLFGSLGDLQFASEAAAALSDTQRVHDEIGDRALWTACVISYARAFSMRGGTRYLRADDLFAQLPHEARKLHDFMMELRNKHVAHSVSEQEYSSIGWVVQPPELRNPKFEGVSQMHAVFVLPSDLSGVRDLLVAVTAEVQRSAQAALQAVVDEARNLPLEEIYGRPAQLFTVPGAVKPRPQQRQQPRR